MTSGASSAQCRPFRPLTTVDQRPEADQAARGRPSGPGQTKRPGADQAARGRPSGLMQIAIWRSRDLAIGSPVTVREGGIGSDMKG